MENNNFVKFIESHFCPVDSDEGVGDFTDD